MLGEAAEVRKSHLEAIRGPGAAGACVLVQRTGWQSLVYWVAARIRCDGGMGPILIVSPLLASANVVVSQSMPTGPESRLATPTIDSRCPGVPWIDGSNHAGATRGCRRWFQALQF